MHLPLSEHVRSLSHTGATIHQVIAVPEGGGGEDGNSHVGCRRGCRIAVDLVRARLDAFLQQMPAEAVAGGGIAFFAAPAPDPVDPFVSH